MERPFGDTGSPEGFKRQPASESTQEIYFYFRGLVMTRMERCSGQTDFVSAQEAAFGRLVDEIASMKDHNLQPYNKNYV